MQFTKRIRFLCSGRLQGL